MKHKKQVIVAVKVKKSVKMFAFPTRKDAISFTRDLDKMGAEWIITK